MSEADQTIPPAAESPPDTSGAENSADQPDMQEEEYIEYLGKLPSELGTMLVIVGVAGVLLPGPVGTPMLIAGAVALWPKTFAPMERRFAKKFPAAHREGVKQIRRYISDLNRRFPNDPLEEL